MTTRITLIAIRRLMARHGSPQIPLSSNAKKFLSPHVSKIPLKINNVKIITKLRQRSIDWRLNPLSAPHIDYVWECLVLIIKRVYLMKLGIVRLSRDLFSTIVVECEGHIN